jgi:hypothetical protein
MEYENFIFYKTIAYILYLIFILDLAKGSPGFVHTPNTGGY